MDLIGTALENIAGFSYLGLVFYRSFRIGDGRNGRQLDHET